MQLPEFNDAIQRDSDIVRQLRQGANDQAFNLLVERYARKVYSLCHALLRNRAAAEDASQESLLRIWRALPNFDGRAALSTWIYAITRNRCLTSIERQRASDSLLDPDAQPSDEHVQGVGHELELEDHLVLLRDLVDALPERYRRILVLFYYEQRSVGEVVEMLGIPEGTVKVSLFRARALLLTQIKQLGMADPLLWLDTTP